MSADLLPTNATPLQRAICAAAARVMAVDAEVIAKASRAAATPIGLIAWLAWARSVDEWEPGWTEDQKRAVTAGALPYHGRKGEPAGVRAALAQLGMDAVMSEWFEYGGAPYLFRVAVALALNTGFGLAEQQSLLRLVNKAKNARSLLDRIDLAARMQDAQPHTAAWLPLTVQTMTLYAEVIGEDEIVEVDGYLFDDPDNSANLLLGF